MINNKLAYHELIMLNQNNKYNFTLMFTSSKGVFVKEGSKDFIEPSDILVSEEIYTTVFKLVNLNFEDNVECHYQDIAVVKNDSTVYHYLKEKGIIQ